MNPEPMYFKQIQEMIEANGWSKDLIVVVLESEAVTSGAPVRVQISLSGHHPVAPRDLINIYQEGIHPLEQVQQECLRALRTGRSGI